MIMNEWLLNLLLKYDTRNYSRHYHKIILNLNDKNNSTVLYRSTVNDFKKSLLPVFMSFLNYDSWILDKEKP